MKTRTLCALTLLGLSGCTCKPASPPPAPPRTEATVQAGQVAPTPAPLPSLAPLVESVSPSVVNVEVIAHGGDEGPEGDGPARGGGSERRQGLGSGVVLNEKGHVLTNHHVVSGAEAIRVTLPDSRSFPARVLGRDPLTDVAVLQLEGKLEKLPFAKLGDSDKLAVGEWVVAIGNPFGLASSVSVGILSARERDLGAGPYDQFLQTDAAINPGNSGGPLFNLKGEVVGINTAIVGGGAGIGFAVPASLLRALLPDLEEGHGVQRGWLGVGVQDLTPLLAEGLGLTATGGAVVGGVGEGTPGAAAGLREDDVIVALDGAALASAGELIRKVGLRRPGAAVKLKVHRGTEVLELEVKLGTRPDLEGVGPIEGSPPAAAPEEGLGLVVRDAGLLRGAQVVQVAPGSAAERAELAPGMVVVEAGGKPVRRAADLAAALRSARPGGSLLLRIQAGAGRALRALTVPR